MEEDKLDLAKKILQDAKSRNVKFLLPVDHVVADRIDAGAKIQTVKTIPENLMGLDIGPESVELFSEEISRAATIVWNGPMGVFEMSPFAKGTFKLARAVADNAGATSIVGGGDSVSAVTGSRSSGQDLAHFNRRWSIAGISRRQRIARSQSAYRQTLKNCFNFCNLWFPLQ